LSLRKLSLRLSCVALCSMVVAGCASQQYAPNDPLPARLESPPYAFPALARGSNSDSMIVTLSLSGGGYRAAAFASAVLHELRQAQIEWKGQRKPLLDEVDWIVSVSGGSLAAAYYGLHRETFFDRFESDVLMADLQGQFFSRALSPHGLWRATAPRFGRGDILQEVLDESVFRGARFSDLPRIRPAIVVNAAEMTLGELFQFTQEQFDHLCSDMNTLPLSRAVAASMAVPVVFSPITLWNYSQHCASTAEKPRWGATRLRAQRYLHLVDGGLADNLGIRGPLEVIAARGGIVGAAKDAGLQGLEKLVFIVVNSQVSPEFEEDASPNTPTILRQARAVIDIPINRYTSSSIETLRSQVAQWRDEVRAVNASLDASARHDIDFYVIEVTAEDADDPAATREIQAIPTTLRLAKKDIRAIEKFVRQRLKRDPEFKRLMHDVGVGVEPNARTADGLISSP
jgi:NTE family protein